MRKSTAALRADAASTGDNCWPGRGFQCCIAAGQSGNGVNTGRGLLASWLALCVDSVAGCCLVAIVGSSDVPRL